jgi:hypothetical protein
MKVVFICNVGIEYASGCKHKNEKPVLQGVQFKP